MLRIYLIRIISILAIISIVYLVVVDYGKFNIYEPSNLLIYGNDIVPSNIIIDRLNGKLNDKSIYSIIIGKITAITISNNQDLIIVEEDVPRFYDDKMIYLKSGTEIAYKNYSDYNEIIAKHNIPLFIYEDTNLLFSEKILDLIDLLSKSNASLFNDLKSITISKSKILSIKINQCKIILVDKVDESLLKVIPGKIKILNSLITQSNRDINNIDEIDLRWDNKVFIKTI